MKIEEIEDGNFEKFKMRKKSRFLSLPYLFNTFVIKTKALALKVMKGGRPFDYFKGNTLSTSHFSYNLNYLDKYHSLSYLNNSKAIRLHSGERSITQQLILGLVEYNESMLEQDSSKSALLNLAQTLKDECEESNGEMAFYFDEAYTRFDLKGKYMSGIVQGKAASFFLRCYGISKDDKYKEWAKKCLLAVWSNNDKSGVLKQLPNEMVWIEEYPSPSPSMVLNGFLFYIIGLAEYQTFEYDEELHYKLEICLKSSISWMPNYKLNQGLLYSMYRWSLCNVHYTGIMKYQFEHLYELTKIPIFKEYADFTDGLTNWKTFDQLFDL